MTELNTISNTTLMPILEGFAPIVADKAGQFAPKVLILGTMPSVQSLADQFYYAHPRNAFWPIMAELFQHPITTTEDKIDLITSQGLALWDVLRACQRKGSLDAAIKAPQANDFESFLKSYPYIKTIVFNGKAAQTLFKNQVLKQQALPAEMRFFDLPSTSPANARLTFENKRVLWQETFSKIV